MTAVSRRDSVEFVTVLQILNGFAAVHVNNGEHAFISQSLEKAREVALLAAQEFAKAKKITLMDMKRETIPIFTVIQKVHLWYPAKVYAEYVHLLEYVTVGNTVKCTWGTQEVATAFAVQMMRNEQGIFSASLGMNLSG